jgi:uncharacterized protein (DUF302 family)
MIYKRKTNKTIERILIDLKKHLNDIGFGVLWEMNFKDKFDEKGLEFDGDFKILEVCNPVKAHMVLNSNIDMGFFLPCKIAVFEHEGEIFIGMPEPTKMMSFAEQPAVGEMALEVETLLKSAIDQSL